MDLHDGIDAGIIIYLDTAKLIDEVDSLSDYVNVYFTITIDSGPGITIDIGGSPFVIQTGITKNFKIPLYLDIDDNRRYIKISTAMVDEDYPAGDELIDIDGVNRENRTLDIIFDLTSGTWYGENTNGSANGSFVGTGSSDDNDGSLDYHVSIVKIASPKTFSWDFSGHHYDLTVKIYDNEYNDSKNSDTERWPYTYQAASFATVDDPVVQKVAGDLSSMASARGFSQLERAKFVLNFVQSINYSYDSESTRAEEYWRFPLETLYDQTGDCEDTSILYAAIMEALGNDAILVILSDHMAVRLSVPGASGGYYAYGSVNYYYCETTGTGWEIGEIPYEFEGMDPRHLIQIP